MTLLETRCPYFQEPFLPACVPTFRCTPPPSCHLPYRRTTSMASAGSPLVGPSQAPGGPSTTTDICACQVSRFRRRRLTVCFLLLRLLLHLVRHAAQLTLRRLDLLLHTFGYFPVRTFTYSAPYNVYHNFNYCYHIIMWLRANVRASECPSVRQWGWLSDGGTFRTLTV